MRIRGRDMRSNSATNLEQWVGILIWCLGIIPFYFLWNTRIFVHEWMEALFGFVLYVAAFFYGLALVWCVDLAKKLLSKGDSGNEES